MTGAAHGERNPDRQAQRRYHDVPAGRATAHWEANRGGWKLRAPSRRRREHLPLVHDRPVAVRAGDHSARLAGAERSRAR
jgi:hypothetical protein